MIRFFELDENGERVWDAVGTFLQSDVHHQYAIVFRYLYLNTFAVELQGDDK